MCTLLCFLFLINIFYPSSLHAQSPKQLVAIGDSIPYGYNLKEENTSPPGQAFPYLIGGKGNLEVTNLSIPGLTSKEMLLAVRENELFRETLKEADYVILYIGGNDLLNLLKKHKGLNGVKMDEVAYVVRNLLYNVYSIAVELDQLTEGEILVYNLYNPYPEQGEALEEPLELINKQYSSLIELLSHFTNIKHVDAYHAFRDHPEYIIPGDVHPSKEGQKVLAKIGWKQMKKK
ncbi:SGNH/GDSL hydrolase family protein [Halobacillus sp. Marseille-Q1614]|uniref:SGNH/GDSL hydrolase family protein n=1 Tax=Halobacillus sp. Marseille-Q1614 TaxID=2709134 RepID=UPI0020C55D3B|nr:SGNH/GDSL hydrolase family protein [Halobacillus sp. Marseille-Q1614]